jgi:alpha-acetolactate decarboxylase
MKKVIITLVLVLVSSPFFAQAAFDKFDGEDGITSIIVNKKMFELMSKVKVDASDKETQQYMNLIKKLDNLKVFTTSSSSATADMKSTAEKYIRTAGLEELMRVNDNGKNIKILVKSGTTDSQIRELLMFIEGANKANETVLMSLTGNFDLNEISILTDKMRIPGGEDLKRATKGKK